MTDSFFKYAAIAAIAATMSVAASAQSFVKGDNVAGVSIGFGGYYSGALYSGSGVSRIPAISLYYENCVKDNLFDAKSSLGIGGYLGYTSIKVADVLKTSNTVIGVRGALHYGLGDKFDAYTGLMLGYDIVSWKWLDTYGGLLGGNASSSGLAFSWFLGGRYYFTDTFAAFAELGWGVAVFNIGVALKF
jgi:hypothetical protein